MDESGDGAGHVDAATHRRLDLAVTIRALRDLYGRSVITLDRVVHERGIARAARCVDGHSAGRAFVGGHARTVAGQRPGDRPGALRREGSDPRPVRAGEGRHRRARPGQQAIGARSDQPRLRPGEPGRGVPCIAARRHDADEFFRSVPFRGDIELRGGHRELVLVVRSASESISMDASTAATVEGYQRPPLAVGTCSVLRSVAIACRASPASRSAAMRARTDSGSITGCPSAIVATVLFINSIILPPTSVRHEANDPSLHPTACGLG